MTGKTPPPEGEAREALRAREAVRAFALELPEAVEEFPWGEDAVAKVNRKIFVFLGGVRGGHAPRVTVKLRDPDAHAHALSFPAAAPSGYGLGRSGWVTIPLAGREAPAVDLLCDWVLESYRDSCIHPRCSRRG
ncbi:MmcQ/YjbR family DNA-binding protein [Streptomyces oceani]|uniref:dGTPase n=1 Tax=Streptomyces oceani TaxID=1075402 RepID=A0A1E7KJD3_9ACTN|nr:MmcQ/YjbR family DNA-binding protein [Streptomyces oceani]OEV04069.1 dGTPase [Streptomyces oceani]